MGNESITDKHLDESNRISRRDFVKLAVYLPLSFAISSKSDINELDLLSRAIDVIKGYGRKLARGYSWRKYSIVNELLPEKGPYRFTLRNPLYNTLVQKEVVKKVEGGKNKSGYLYEVDFIKLEELSEEINKKKKQKNI